MLRLIINLNRCLNTIYGIQAQDNDHNKEFLDSYTGGIHIYTGMGRHQNNFWG